MRLYDSLGPNPRVVRMYASELEIALELEAVDLPGGENRRGEYLEKNPAGQLPALELEDGIIGEVTAICEYLDETVGGSSSLMGATAVERAQTRMWTRRVDLRICEPLANGFRAAEGYELFKDRMRVLPDAADGLKAIATDGLQWLNELLGDGPWLCGERFSLADIHLYCFLDFGQSVGQPLPADCANVATWLERVAARASAEASLHPLSSQFGIRG